MDKPEFETYEEACAHLQRENDKLREQLDLARLDVELWKGSSRSYAESFERQRERAEAAEAKLRELSEQEPLSGWFSYNPIDGKLDRCDPRCGREVFRLYAAPIQPADVQELRNAYDALLTAKDTLISEQKKNIDISMSVVENQQERIAELKRNLAELAAIFNAEVCGATHMGEPVITSTHFETAEWSHLERQVALSQAREEGRKEAVPESLLNALRNWSGAEPSQSVLAREVDNWLAFAPKPEAKGVMYAGFPPINSAPKLEMKS